MPAGLPNFQSNDYIDDMRIQTGETAKTNENREEAEHTVALKESNDDYKMRVSSEKIRESDKTINTDVTVAGLNAINDAAADEPITIELLKKDDDNDNEVQFQSFDRRPSLDETVPACNNNIVNIRLESNRPSAIEVDKVSSASRISIMESEGVDENI